MAEDVNGPEIEEESEAGNGKKGKKPKKIRVKKEKVKKEKVKKEKVKKPKAPKIKKSKKSKKAEASDNAEGSETEQLEVELIPIKKAMAIIFGCVLFSIAFLSAGVFAGMHFIKPIIDTNMQTTSTNKPPKKSSRNPADYFGTTKDTSGGPIPGYPNLSWVSPEMKAYYLQLEEEKSYDEQEQPQLDYADAEEAAIADGETNE